jgi:hypothetical protein
MRGAAPLVHGELPPFALFISTGRLPWHLPDLGLALPGRLLRSQPPARETEGSASNTRRSSSPFGWHRVPAVNASD